MDPSVTRLYHPGGLKDFKKKLFKRVGKRMGGITYSFHKLSELPKQEIPVVGCSPELQPLIREWVRDNRPWIYWDRGYARRVFATWLERGDDGGYYRWHINSFQMTKIRDVPDDRWKALDVRVRDWDDKAKEGHIVIAAPPPTYARFHGIPMWTTDTINQIKKFTDRKIIVREKSSQVPLQADLKGAHALVSHGSIAAVESVILGCPVFVDQSSAAALVGRTDLCDIETPIFPDRQPWLNSLAYCQFNEKELTDGTLWRLIE